MDLLYNFVEDEMYFIHYRGKLITESGNDKQGEEKDKRVEGEEYFIE